MKAQIFDITHTTYYRYRAPVHASYNLMRLTPRQLGRQQCLEHRLEISPTPEAQSTHTDYFGNEVTFASLAEPHQELRITSRSKVAVSPPYLPDSSETPAWETVAALCAGDRSRQALEAAEFLFASPQIPISPHFAVYAAPSFTPRRPILEAILDITERIHRDFTFDPAATTVATPLEEVLAKRRGVCQDFAHFEIACLRSLGLPARYISGYLETIPPPGHPKLTGADASHAWISFYCPGIGWIDADPTNNVIPSMSHITLAWGRDYGDVCPVRGVVNGGENATLAVAVDVVARHPGGQS